MLFDLKIFSNDKTFFLISHEIAQNNQTKRLYQTFPGPLSPATHPKQVIDFCLEQIRVGPTPNSTQITRSANNSMSSIHSAEQSNRASFSLLWNLLILLIRQRGAFDGSNIAELLLKNRDEFPYEQLNSTKSSSSKGASDSLSDIDSREDSNDLLSSQSEQPSLSEEEVTDKFRNFLLYGSLSEALDWATENNLWGHALFLASQMDRRSQVNVKNKFLNKLVPSDPLQTLYQLKNGHVPLSVTVRITHFIEINHSKTQP